MKHTIFIGISLILVGGFVRITQTLDAADCPVGNFRGLQLSDSSLKKLCDYEVNFWPTQMNDMCNKDAKRDDIYCNQLATLLNYKQFICYVYAEKSPSKVQFNLCGLSNDDTNKEPDLFKRFIYITKSNLTNLYDLKQRCVNGLSVFRPKCLGETKNSNHTGQGTTTSKP